VPSQQPSGRVIAQSAAPGKSVPKGSKVRLAVSLGPSATTTAVPDVVGQDQQTATSMLQDAGFRVQVITVPPPDPSQSGRVVDEQPAGGTRAPDGSTVTIYVGSG
jgi:serine/threonine-protein kinase